MPRRPPDDNDFERTRITLIKRCQEGITPVVPASGVRMDESMIDRARGIDPKAWNVFYKVYRNFAYCVIRNKVYKGEWYFPEDGCREIAHDAVVIASDHMLNKPDKEFDFGKVGTVKFRTWFYYRILDAKNKYLRTHFDPVSENSVEFDPEKHDRAESDTAFHEQREQAIWTTALELLAQSRIKKRNIEAFQMYIQRHKEAADPKVADIAAELDMSADAVHQAVSRCRKYLAERRKELESLI